MAKTPKPRFRKGRGWFVTVSGTQHNLGRDEKAAFQEYYRLMRQPVKHKQVSGQSLVFVIDKFLNWVHINRAPDTYLWYRDLLQKFAEVYPDLRADDIRPFHVDEWTAKYPHLSKTSRRNHPRSVKRCLGWALRQRYIDENPIEHIEVTVRAVGRVEQRELFAEPLTSGVIGNLRGRFPEPSGPGGQQGWPCRRKKPPPLGVGR